jgi:hypothetical protein
VATLTATRAIPLKSPEFFLNFLSLLGIPLEFPWNSFGICMEFSLSFPEISPEFSLENFGPWRGLCPRSHSVTKTHHEMHEKKPRSPVTSWRIMGNNRRKSCHGNLRGGFASKFCSKFTGQVRWGKIH